MSVVRFGSSSASCCPSQEQVNASTMISLLSCICTKANAAGMSVTTGCLQVTVEGDWGEVGDTIQVIRWFDAQQVPPTSFYTLYINTRTNTLVTGISESNTTECETIFDGSITINGVFNFEYFICDDGVQKIVQICGTSCGAYNVNYLAFDRSESTEPADWNLVTAGSCATNLNLVDPATPSEWGIYIEGVNTGLGYNGQVTSGVSRDSIINQGSTSIGGNVIPLHTDLSGRLVHLPYANPDSTFIGYNVISGDAVETFVLAPGSGIYSYITDIIVVNLRAVATTVEIASSGFPLTTFGVVANGTANHAFNIPLKSNADDTVITCQAADAADNLAITILGYFAAF